MPVGGRMESCPVHRAPPEGFSLTGLDVRPVTPRERPLRDALMDRHHLGLRRLAGQWHLDKDSVRSDRKGPALRA